MITTPLVDEWIIVHTIDANNRVLQHLPLGTVATACHTECTYGQHIWCHDLPSLFSKTRPHEAASSIAKYLGHNKLLQAMHLMHTLPLGSRH